MKKMFWVAGAVAALALMLLAQTTAVKPVIVRDLDNGDRATILHGQKMMTLNNGEQIASDCAETVPAGKRWVLNHVTVHAPMVMGQVPSFTIMATSLGSHYLPSSLLGGPFTAMNWYIWQGSHPVTMRLPAGSSLCFVFARGNGTAQQVNAVINYSGYAIDYP